MSRLKILKVEACKETKKFKIYTESDTVLTDLERERYKQKIQQTLGYQDIELFVEMPASPDPVLPPPPEVVQVAFSADEYEKQQQEHIKQAAKNLAKSGGSYSGGDGKPVSCGSGLA
ncbi:MAG: hypothetical protein IKV74_02360, partial [Clostridia bacterium]|nr:hypothetical protein [Clostridia bacterium]